MGKRVNFLVFLLILIGDQLTKVLAYTHLSLGRPVPVIPRFFNLTLVYNPGAAFGMFAGLPDTQRRVMLIVVSLIALIVVLRLFSETKGDWVSQFALSSILAGATGNIIDRFRFDSVVDFLDFYVGTYHWPAFNVADSAISVGVFILVIRLFFAAKKDEAVTNEEVVCC